MGFLSGGGWTSPGSGGSGGGSAANIIDKLYRLAENGDDTRADVAADRYDQTKPWRTLQAIFNDINVNELSGVGIKIAPGDYAGGALDLESPGGCKIEAEVGGAVNLTSGILLQGDSFGPFEIRGVNAVSSGHCIDGGSAVISSFRVINCNLISTSFNEECVDVNADLVEIEGGSIQQSDSGSGANPRLPLKITSNSGNVPVTLKGTRIAATSFSNDDDTGCVNIAPTLFGKVTLICQGVIFQVGRLGADVTGRSSLALVAGSAEIEARFSGCSFDVGVNNPNGQNGPELEIFSVTNTAGVVDIKSSSLQVNWRGIDEADVYTASMDNVQGEIAMVDTSWLDMTTDTLPGRRTVGADQGVVRMEGINNFTTRA